jgi:phosphatidylglycerophosphate synthase
MSEPDNRRPIAARGAGWAHWLADRAAEGGASPDLISATSFCCALLGAALLLVAGGVAFTPVRALLLMGAAGAIQLRLVCNLIDGMVAVEHRQGGSAGPIWNELPDRFSDVVLFAAAGYSLAAQNRLGGIELGWIAATLALICAYVRELGRGMGFPADFSGPMAKQHRMAVLTIACLVSTVEQVWGWRGQTLMLGLAVIAVGAAATIWRRTATLAGRLAERARQNPSGGNP